jgi:hypothetical protein
VISVSRIETHEETFIGPVNWFFFILWSKHKHEITELSVKEELLRFERKSKRPGPSTLPGLFRKD